MRTCHWAACLSGDTQAFNGYGYANYNPVSDSDPSGLTRDDGGHTAESEWKWGRVYNDGGYLWQDYYA
jgi:hypothetical protein